MKEQPFTFFRLITFLSLFVVLAACGDSPVAPEPDPTVSGGWSGTTGTTTFQLTLNESATGAVTGSGSISEPGFALALTVENGTHVFPNLSLILAADGFQDINLVGTVTSATTIAATLNGSGFANDNINLTKSAASP